jgi:hypothetical protein
MKNILIAGLLVVILAAALSAQETEKNFSISSFARSGIFWQKEQLEGADATEYVSLYSKDDAGNNPKSNQGRWRLEMEYAQNNMGIKTRIQWDNWRAAYPDWIYAFAYGDFFEEQLSVSVGKLGGSPWGTGGPEMWKELEISQQGGGMRMEVKPAVVPGLNVGFVFNWFNHPNDQGWDFNIKPLTLMELLKESALGASYVHDLFLARFAFRFDSEVDRVAGNGAQKSDGEEEYAFRIEEKVLANWLPGFQIWALGYGMGLGAEGKGVLLLQNWLFFQYDPQYFTAQIRMGYDYTESRSIIHFKPSFYWKFFDNLLNAGVSFWYGQDFGEYRIDVDSPFQFWEIEPKVQLNFGSSSYIAFAYNFRQEYKRDPNGLLGHGLLYQTQFMNLRYCLTL